MHSDNHVPSNLDEQHYFDGNDEHFPVSAECSDLKKVNENNIIYYQHIIFPYQIINATFNLTCPQRYIHLHVQRKQECQKEMSQNKVKMMLGVFSWVIKII